MIHQPYLLVMTLPTYEDDRGDRTADELWRQDLVEHLVSIADLRLFAPVERGEPPRNAQPIAAAGFPGVLSFDDLPSCASTRATLRHLPMIAARLWRAVGRAEIVHANAGGWPISFGWLAIPMARLRGKFTVVVVESGSWRLGFRRPWRPRAFVEACLFEGFGRLIVNLADVAVFTHAGYRDGMLAGWRRGHGHVIPASWIGPADILGRDEARDGWRAKGAEDRPLRVVFAANLKTSKGVLTLLDAARQLDGRGAAIQIDVYGAGGLLPEVVAAAAELGRGVALRHCGTIAYGEPFFRMLAGYDLMVVPSLSDEQPRVIFDAFARALPVVASATAGNAECVADNINGRLVPVGDAAALADAIEWAARNRPRLAEMGINALDVARGLTHDQMHARRARIIEAAYDARRGDVAPSAPVDPLRG